MYPNNSGYGPRGPQNMYQLHPGLGGGPGVPGGPGARQYPPQYYRMPPYGSARPERPPHQTYRHHMQGELCVIIVSNHVSVKRAFFLAT